MEREREIKKHEHVMLTGDMRKYVHFTNELRGISTKKKTESKNVTQKLYMTKRCDCINYPLHKMYVLPLMRCTYFVVAQTFCNLRVAPSLYLLTVNLNGSIPGF